VSYGFRRDNRDRLFEALKKAQAARDGAVVLEEQAASHTASRRDRRQMALIAALIAAAGACAALAWALLPD
jgi:hypothetical protein